jgi:hypothetical protein
VPVGVMNEDVNAFWAQEDVPNSEPVIPLEADIIDAVKDVATLSELRDASDPDVINFFQFGTPIFIMVGYNKCVLSTSLSGQ